MQQLRLQRRFHLGDLVQKDRAGIGLFELSDAGRRRARERALLVTEQLAFQELGRQRRAIDLHERPLLARRPLMDGARDELFPDTALAANQHGDVAVRHLLDHLSDGFHVGAVAPEQEGAILIVAQLPAQLGDLRD